MHLIPTLLTIEMLVRLLLALTQRVIIGVSIGREIGCLTDGRTGGRTHKSKKLPNGRIERMGNGSDR